MSVYQRILLATDLSPASQSAERTALTLARALGAEVSVLHVVALPPGLDARVAVQPEAGTPALPLRDYVEAADRRELERVVAAFRDAGVPVSMAVEVGSIAETIADVGRRSAADLIVVGTHGRTGIRRVVLGSVAARLLTLTPVPVLVARHDAEDTIPDADEQALVEAEG